jgi:hypothetical protein
MIFFILLFFQTIALFFVSRHSTNQLFQFLRIFIKNEKWVFAIVSFLYLPGTILHEMAHFFAAMALFLKVKDINIFPEFKKDYIKLGSVLYEKKDFVRSFLVGIAPFFAGIFFFYYLSIFKLFPSVNLLQNLLFSYLIFAVSSTMFSSKQDLIDFIFIIPFVIFGAGIIYIFQIDFTFILKNEKAVKNLVQFLKEINFYLFISLIINLSLIIILKSFRFFLRLVLKRA